MSSVLRPALTRRGRSPHGERGLKLHVRRAAAESVDVALLMESVD